MNLRAQALVIAPLLMLPQMAVACAQLSSEVWMCDRGTPWEAAEWDGAGDGQTRFLGNYVLNFTQEWPGFEIADADSTLEEQFATYAEWIAADDAAPVEVLQVDTVVTPRATALRHLQRDRVDEQEVMSAVMLAQVSDARIMVFLDTPATTPLAEIDTLSRTIVALLADHCADEIACAQDEDPPSGGTE